MFCPFRSTAEKEIECSKNCACFSNETQLGRCVFLDLSENISNLSMNIETNDNSDIEERLKEIRNILDKQL